MPKFLVLYTAGGSGGDGPGELTPGQQQAVMKAWFDWKGEAGDAIVDFGAPTVAVGGSDSAIGGYSIVEAETADALAAIFENNPHRRQGGNLEFHQILDMPGG